MFPARRWFGRLFDLFQFKLVGTVISEFNRDGFSFVSVEAEIDFDGNGPLRSL